MKRLMAGRKRVVVAMSGGVDSSVVAGLLCEAGHDVIGVMMKLYSSDDPDPASEKACCGLDDVSDARRVADTLGIPFYLVNYQTDFKKEVIDRFVDDYAKGRTPNPCVRCNDTVKFETLLSRARLLGADYLATGHYVRTEVSDEGEVALYRGVDRAKDQSYFLAGISRDALQRVIFPLGGMTKQEVREHAERLALPTATKRESQEICFVTKGDYAQYLEDEAAEKLGGPGPIIGLNGLRIGQHKGLHRYTVGQRRGLGLSGPEPRYVVGLQTEDNALVVGPRDAASSDGLWASEERWISASAPQSGMRLHARIRHKSKAVAARVSRGEGDRLEVWLDEPLLGVSPGQQVAFYDAERLLGAATIEGTFRRDVGPSGGEHGG